MYITFYKLDSFGRMRYFSLHDRQRDLFEPFTLTSISGTTLRAGKEKTLYFSKEEERDMQIKRICRARLHLGYKVLYAFSRQDNYRKWFSKLQNPERRAGLLNAAGQ